MRWMVCQFFLLFFCTNQILYAYVVIVQSYSDLCGSIGRSRFNLKYLNFHFHYFDLYFYQLSRWKFSFHFRSVFLSRRTHGRDVFMGGKNPTFYFQNHSPLSQLVVEYIISGGHLFVVPKWVLRCTVSVV